MVIVKFEEDNEHPERVENSLADFLSLLYIVFVVSTNKSTEVSCWEVEFPFSLEKDDEFWKDRPDLWKMEKRESVEVFEKSSP